MSARVAIRRRWRQVCVLVFALSAFDLGAQPQPMPTAMSLGLFSDVSVLQPEGEVRQFVMLLSNEASASAADQQFAQSMVKRGALVAIVPIAPFYARLETQSKECAYAAGAFENLARRLQAIAKMPTYLEPMLVGSGDAGAFAYALLAQAPAGTFASALSVGFCPRLNLKTPLCLSNALRSQAAADGKGVELKPAPSLGGPWIALQSTSDFTCNSAARSFAQNVPQAAWIALAGQSKPEELPQGFESAYQRLAAHRLALGPPPAQLADLPVVEVPTTTHGYRMAVLLSGDGGWASIDKSLAAALVKQGIPVVGFDSLRYFWSARTPEGLTTDVDRLIRYYAARWQRSEVILIGYSQGADVLPFVLNRLPAKTRTSVRLTALLGPGQNAAFEFHVANWIGASGDIPIAPEALKLSADSTLCIYGADERNSLCPQLAPDHARALPLTGGHHFGGDYDALAAHILNAVPR